MYTAWTDDLDERETIHAANAKAAAEAYAKARVDDIDGLTIHVEDEDGRVRHFVVTGGVTALQESP